jgi:hypothetical protein
MLNEEAHCSSQARKVPVGGLGCGGARVGGSCEVGDGVGGRVEDRGAKGGD